MSMLKTTAFQLSPISQVALLSLLDFYFKPMYHNTTGGVGGKHIVDSREKK